MLLRPVERADVKHSQLADLHIYLVIVLLHCVATITPRFTVTHTLMTAAVSCIYITNEATTIGTVWQGEYRRMF